MGRCLMETIYKKTVAVFCHLFVDIHLIDLIFYTVEFFSLDPDTS